MSIPDRPARPLFVKRLVIPGEHGAWAWLLVPFAVGLTVASALAGGHIGRFPGLAAFLVLLGGLAAFLARQPATAWLRMQRGRGQRALAPLALGWAIGLGAAALLSFAGLLLLGRTALWSLVAAAAGIFAAYLYASQLGRAGLRAVWMEAAGAAGLSLMAPAAVAAVAERLPPAAWALWSVVAAHNVLAVLYVRLRLADTHRRPAGRHTVALLHLLALLLAIAAGFAAWVPAAVSVVFVALLARAVWAAAAPRPVDDVRRFGFTELAVSLAAGGWIAGSFLLAL
jgi:hypothetical protein